MADRDTPRDTSNSPANNPANDPVDRLTDKQAEAGGGDLADQATQLGRQALGGTQRRVRGLLEQQTDRAADRIDGVAAALHKAAEQMDEENNRFVGQYVGQAADRMDEMADMIRNSTLDDMLSQVEGFARRQPEIFVGGAFALGFLAARFIKSSGEDRRRATDCGPGRRRGFPSHGGSDRHAPPQNAATASTAKPQAAGTLGNAPSSASASSAATGPQGQKA